jgi:hypothetical protein
MPLFKYCGESGLKVLKNLEIKVTPPNEFNDPFEFSPVVRTKDPKGHAEREVQKLIDDPRFFNENRGHFPGVPTFAAFQEFARVNRDMLIRTLDAGAVKLDAELDVLNTLSQKFGVICLSGDPLQPLMWAHYSSSHTGMRPEPTMHIADPACGTGGFLLAAYEYLVKSNPGLDRKAQRFLNEEAIRGMDIVPSVTRLCAMNLYLHGMGGTEKTIVETADSLAKKPAIVDMVLTQSTLREKKQHHRHQRRRKTRDGENLLRAPGFLGHDEQQAIELRAKRLFDAQGDRHRRSGRA